MVNPVVDGYIKTLNHRKTVREIQKKQLSGNQKSIKAGVQLKNLSCSFIILLKAILHF